MTDNKEIIKISVDSKDLSELYAAFRNLDKDTNDALKAEVWKLSNYVARGMQMAAEYAPNPRQARIVAQSVKANKDRIPNVTIGGSRIARVSRKKSEKNPLPKMGQLLFGSEFGSNKQMFPQGGAKFPRWSGRYGGGSRGWWIFPTLRKLQPKITRDYHAIVDKYIKKDWAE